MIRHAGEPQEENRGGVRGAAKDRISSLGGVTMGYAIRCRSCVQIA